MLRHIKTLPAFYNALRAAAREWLAMPEEQFEKEWRKVDALFDKESLAMTSSFNVDTWLIQCVEKAFPELRIRRKDVERLFF
jgi:hypothetical protein